MVQAIRWLENPDHESHILTRHSKAVALETIWHIIFGEDHILAAPKKNEKCQLFTC